MKIQCEDKEKLTFKVEVIEVGISPSNVVVYDKDRDTIISANGELVLYFVT